MNLWYINKKLKQFLYEYTRCKPDGVTDWVAISSAEPPGRMRIRDASFCMITPSPRLLFFPHAGACPVDLVVERRAGAARILADADIRLFRELFPKNLFDYRIRVCDAAPVSASQLAIHLRERFAIMLPSLEGYRRRDGYITPKDGMTLRELIADYFAPVREAGDGVSWNPVTSSFEIEKPWTTRLFATIRRWWRDATGAP